MSEISRVALFGKLNPLAYKAIEGATVFCKLRGNPYVELVHWLAQLLQTQDSDLHRVDPALRARHLGAVAQGHDGRARPPAARRDRDLRLLARTSRTRSSARWVYALAAVRRGAGAHRLPAGRHAEDAEPAQRAARHLASSSRRSRSTTWPTTSPRSCDASPESKHAARRTAPAWAAARPAKTRGAMAPAAMGKQEALKKFAVDLTEKAQEGRDRPGDRARRRDPPDRRHPDAPAPEQPDPHRRGGRRQDRGGRRLRAAHRARRRAAAAQGRAAAHARPRPAAGRRQHEGRVRAAPAPGDRRGAGHRRSRSSCSSTRCTRWSAPAARPAPATRPTC